VAAFNNLIALVVEDDRFQRRTVARMLRSLGLREVREAGDGREALESMRNGAPVDLVVCDLDMPAMDGMEFIRHLGQGNCAASVVISSARDRSLVVSVEKMALAYGVQLLGLMEKPVTLAGLEDLLAKHGGTEPRLKQLARGEVTYQLDEILAGMRQRQFVTFYQPQISLATGHMIGMEALTRWRHPRHGLVMPGAFIGALELSGDIDELTIGLLDDAARACRTLRERGVTQTVSVNLSLVSLTDTMMAERITQIVLGAGLDPGHMMLEITETAAMTQVAPALENLARLRMRGFGLSVDDYGTGFASLQQMMRVPFTELKIDRSFVTGCAADAASRIVVESCVQMARKLGMKTVAEGVETNADLAEVKAAGCDIAQGYFIARPMELEAMAEFSAAAA
jgi:EAL domain-containing protein (putative c-di-GMP-specific phosphodiesterase class I)